MQKYLLSSVSVLVFVLVNCQHRPSREPAADDSKIDKKQIKAYFKNLSVEERNEAIKKAFVTKHDYQPEQISKLNIITETEKKCGSRFKYQKVMRGNFDSENSSRQYEVYSWPTVECRYKPDDGGFGGFTSKFQCDFENPKAKDGLSTKKVKYAKSSNQVLKSEIVETIIATTLTGMIGFYTEPYCPLETVCHNCPSKDPWSQNRAQAPAVEGNREVFSWSMLENAFPGYSMVNKDLGVVSQGLEWNELKLVETSDPAKARSQLIEREAWILWINFLNVLDAAHFNQRVFCLQAKVGADGKPVCERSIVYTHDYGHSFSRRNFSSWLKHSVFQKSNGDGVCRGNLLRSSVEKTWLKGDVFEPAISAEARDLLVDRLSRITDEQWTQVYQLARAEEASHVPAASFVRAAKSKIAEMKSAPCAPFDSRQSVLAQ